MKRTILFALSMLFCVSLQAQKYVMTVELNNGTKLSLNTNVRKAYSISDGAPLTTSGTYDYSILNGHILIQRKVGNYNETIEDIIISFLSDSEQHTIGEYTISAWNDRQIYHRVND